MASHMLLIGVASLSLAILLRWFVSYMRTILKYPHIPVLIPMKKYIQKKPFDKFAHARSDMTVLTEASSPNHIAYLFGSHTVFREIGRNGDTFLKPLEKIRYRMLNTLGLQLASTQNGVGHERHKRVTKTAFASELMENGCRNMRNIWRNMLCEEGVYPRQCSKYTRHEIDYLMLKVTLGAIGASWFDNDIPWDLANFKPLYRHKKEDELRPFVEKL